MDIYFPSCNFTAASPKTAKKIKAYLQERMPVAGCCRLEKRDFSPQDQGIIVCQACRETLTGRIQTVSLWEYLDQDEQFVFPDYHGLCVNVQDCWRDRDHPEVHEAVRHLLKKMKIEVEEITNCREKADFCGTLHVETADPELLATLALYPDKKISQLPVDVQTALMADHVAQYTQPYVVCDCNRCVKGVRLGGGHPIHLLDLVMGEWH